MSGRVDLLAEVLASLRHGFIMVDGAGRVTRINPQALSFLGLPEQEVRGRRLTEIFPSTRLAEVFTTGRPLVGTTYRGLNHTLRISYFPLGVSDGGAVVVLEPVGSPSPYEEELPSRQNLIDLYEALLAELPLCLVVVDKEARVVYCNDNYRALLKLDDRRVENRPVREIIPFTRLPEVLSTGRPYLDPGLEFEGQKLLVAEVPLKKSGEILGGVGRVVSQDTVALESIRDFRRRFEILENKLLLYKHELETLQQNRSPFAEIIGVSPEMQRLKSQAARIARGEANVLLLGESGTGKELFARAIHLASPRGREPLVKINCAAIPENLLEAELFGYEEGAFTGAVRGGKPGKFELADGGTIFLDEIGDLPLTMQPKLLRVLQERAFERVGGRKTIRVSVRVIAATNKDLQAQVKEGKFRLDLYYRLAVITLHIPPLRERPADIEPLCEMLIERFNRRYGLAVRSLSPEVKEFFKKYSWPGNVRELENVLEYAFNFLEPEEEVIRLHHLPPGFGGEGGPHGLQLKEAVARAEQAAIKKALRAAGGNKQEAARLLGIHPSGLYQKLKKYNLE
ncbi:sigma 54-interacting transcriptional regulator [Thermanaeromonas sp. C210]|uniref:sigma 54-interacting transcriptional regulator n=1 Tax=Thermanaeromonas sp. C210 TaxID=2731925 RepID=UPI0020B8360D|nr:sigma 54-interacting transcriptional regulator [Thermanaeromonas sp. C210]